MLFKKVKILEIITKKNNIKIHNLKENTYYFD